MPRAASIAAVPRALDARRCAAEILDVIPPAMDALRTSMRSHIVEGLSIPQFRCLAYISREPGASVSEVAGFLGVTLATASAMVDRLVRAGHVTLRISPQDRRRAALNASIPGKALVERIRGATRRELADALAGSGEAELQALMDGLAALKKLFARG